MPLFERGYKAAATTELERKTREIEEKDKKAQTREEFDASVSALHTNLTFAERINLISAEQAQAYRDRAKEATIQYEQMMRLEYEERTDSFENPRERSKRYLSMDEAQAEIAKERAAQAAEREAQQSHQSQNYSAPQQSDEERTR